MSLEAIQLQTPLYTLPCFIQGTVVSAHYSPMVGANIMSASFALSYLSDNPLHPTSRSLWSGPRSTMEGIRILHDIPIWYDKTELALDFHIFKIQDLDILIWHPVGKMFQNISPLGTLDATLEGKDISLPILRSKIPWPNLRPRKKQLTRLKWSFP